MTNEQPKLTDAQIETIVERHGGQFKRPAFVPTLTGLGIAIEHESGYFPVPDFWYQWPIYNDNAEYAEKLNYDIFGLTADNAFTIIASTMFKRRDDDGEGGE